MALALTATEVIQKLALAPHPREGGWFIQTYAAAERLAPEWFADGRYNGERAASTAIYYLLEPDTFSEMHRLQSDEVFHFYAGDPVEMLQLTPDGRGRQVLLGNDLASEARPQVLAPRGVWQGSRLVPGGRWALLGCTVSPGFAYEDYESGRRDALTAGWPEWEAMIAELTRQ
jgi:predicted cupin superfamily sugar epimerase